MMDCNAWGKPLKGGIGMGGAMFCRPCAEDVRQEIEALRAEGKPVNALAIGRRIFRETHSVSGYLLRDIPEDLWNQAKHQAVDDGISLREMILEALRAYLNGRSSRSPG